MIQISAPVVGSEELEELRGPLETGWLTQGPKVAAFEKGFASRHDVAHAIATTSCTTALHLALLAAGVGPGDEVIVPAFTWIATANAVRYCGATPVFADVDERTYNMTPETVARVVGAATKAVVPVHLFGLCVDIAALRDALPPGTKVIEDAACAVGATVSGRGAGSLGDLAAFSFHPRKIITTGEGGMVTTADADWAAEVRRLRNHGAAIAEEDRHAGPTPFLLPRFDEVGFNYRMTDLQGAVGIAQLGRLDALLAERRSRADWYLDQLSDIPWLCLPVTPEGHEPSWQAFVTRVAATAPLARNEMMELLYEEGVSTRPGTHAVTETDIYRRMSPGAAAACPVSRRLESETMAIPLHNQMSDDDYATVVDALHAV